MKKIKNKFLSIIISALSISMAVSCSACSGNGGSGDKSQPEKTSVVSDVITESQTEISSEKPDVSEEIPEITSPVPEEWQDNGIFSYYYDSAYEKMKSMSLQEKVGQMILARCPDSDASLTAKQYHLGGYILFGRDFEDVSKDKLIANIRSYSGTLDIPMIIAVDEEGGSVSRISGERQLTDNDFLSPRELFDEGGMEEICEDAEVKADLLSSLLINTNLAPVCDICRNPDEFMYYRSLGRDPKITAEFVSEVTKISQKKGVSVALKHFPGYGNNVDTHTGLALDNRTYETFLNNDFLPFKAGIDAGAHLVLVSHNIVECMDKDNPSSLSPEVHRILREELGFTGVVITDDLAMDAISVYANDVPPAVAAVKAGNDMVTVSDIKESFNDIYNAVINGDLDEEQIDHSVMRILAWKYAKGML